MGLSADQKNLSMLSRIPAAWTAPRDTRSMLKPLLLHLYYLPPSLISLLFVPSGFSVGMANSMKNVHFVIISQYGLTLAWHDILMKERIFSSISVIFHGTKNVALDIVHYVMNIFTHRLALLQSLGSWFSYWQISYYVFSYFNIIVVYVKEDCSLFNAPFTQKKQVFTVRGRRRHHPSEDLCKYILSL